MPTISRSAALEAIRGWIGTPYRLGARRRGAGVDCCTLLVEYLIEIGRIPAEAVESLPFYSPDWFLHAGSERYLRALMAYGTAIASGICRADARPAPGDLALFKVVGSRVFNHGAVVTAWPWGVHAGADGVREVDLVACPLTSFRRMEIFDPFEV
jgi:hypothetical protein